QYGKQLRENYRAFKNKQCEQNGGGSPKEQYSSYNVSNVSAMYIFSSERTDVSENKCVRTSFEE
ncbi:hypothetical protein ALC56_00679, partial [Trachymyrmex septentrionalis]